MGTETRSLVQPALARPDTQGSSGLLLVVGFAGAGIMSVELAAVRLLAPWFGTSLAVWTNVIGVILLALALGYLAGARLAARRKPLRSLALALLVSGSLIVWLPALAQPIAAGFLPAGQTLDRAAELLAWGSLATSLVLFLPPALALGCIGPLAVEVVQVRTGIHAGTAGGRVLFASTLGSLLGTFGTTHLFLPHGGLTLTFAAIGGLLAVLGLVLLARSGARGGLLVAALLLSASVLLAPPLALPELPEGQVLLEERESPYQRVRVVETVGGAPWRMLQVNEALDSFQSVWAPKPGLLGRGYYYDAFALPAWWEGAEGAYEVLVLGLGAGTVWRVLEGALPPGCELVGVGVELDPVVVELAQRWMDLPVSSPTRMVLAGWDARAALPLLPGLYDEIVLDVYANQMEIPAHLSTRELFVELEQRLRPGGWLVVNVGGFGLTDPVVKAVGDTVADAFGTRCLALRVPFSRNVALVGRRQAEPPEPGQPGWSDPAWPVSDLLESAALPGAWRWFDPGAERVLTDDRSGIQLLQLRSVSNAGSEVGA